MSLLRNVFFDNLVFSLEFRISTYILYKFQSKNKIKNISRLELPYDSILDK